MLRSLLFASTLVFILSSCIFHKDAAKAAEKPKPSRLVHGMTHAEALEALTDRSEVLVGEFNDPQGHLEAYVYSRLGRAALKAPKFYLYFLNDTLIRKADVEDLRKGAKTALREHREWLLDKADADARRAEAEARKARMEEERRARKEQKEARDEQARQAKPAKGARHEYKGIFHKKKKHKDDEAAED